MNDLARCLDQSWHLMAQHAARGLQGKPLVSLATVDNNGHPQLRTLALRAVRPDCHEVDVYTDALSPKINEIQKTPQVSLLLWRPDEMVQLRVSGIAALTIGHDAKAVWDALPESGHVNYAHQPVPGTEIVGATAYDIRPDPARLAVLTIRVAHIDHVSLAPPKHFRAAFSAQSDWRGQWLSP